MKNIMNTCIPLALAISFTNASDLHDADYILAIQDNQIVTGVVDPDSGEVVYPSQIKSAILGAEGFPNFTNDPGFNAELGQLNPGMFIGFSILRAPRVWDGAAMDFETIATEQITVRAAAQNIVAPSRWDRLRASINHPERHIPSSHAVPAQRRAPAGG
ncbi:MAG TPA: hypothetical protein EYO33_30625 [Phycisphaerales bacterium]|nr:hypothetical protein [Phycisphaerales bacterium]